jgi:hypothetical protein
MIREAQKVVDRLIEFQSLVQKMVVDSHKSTGMHEVNRSTSADTIYQIDTVVEPVLEEFCKEWGKETPLVLVAEGLEDEHGREGAVVFPHGAREEDAEIRVIVDPIDGTRGIMYDKRAAWALAGVAPNKGSATRLRDIEVAVMTELPTSKMGWGDVLWAIKGQGTHGKRVDVRDGTSAPLVIKPSQADNIAHGFASVSNFFPATKMLASETMERIAHELIGPADATKAMVFDDQYISTGGQFYELIVGHDRFNADLRPVFYKMLGIPEGLCCHPYDCATLLIAEEAGVILTDGFGGKLDGPMDVTSGIAWAGFANESLRRQIEPVLIEMFRGRT